MREFLSKEGYMVEQASTAEEALHLLDGATYDLIITDLGLPGMGGEKFLEELTRRKTGIPIIIASGYIHGKKVLENPGHYGVVASLSKPFSVGKLKETVEKVLNIG
jgi:DNA-binding NtrC family response regulator